MGGNWKFRLRQGLKMLLQNGALPCVYRFWRLVYRSREPDRIILADSHHDSLPQSMVVMRQALLDRGYDLTEVYHNYGDMSFARATWLAVKFMRLYAQARVVFICDNFLPVSACKKCLKTTVVQLWHACGLLKKMGYDTADDIPAGYRGHVYRNYDLVTVSSPNCVGYITGAMHLPESVVRPLGVSRTDVYFDGAWQQQCREEFYAAYPQAVGKKVVLWAPTFRGNAAEPRQVGTEKILQLEQLLGPEYFVIRKVHPHVDQRQHLSNCDIVTERLLPVVDLLISDYSTVLTEFLFFGKPYVLFAPDLEEYEKNRGFYSDYGALSPYLVTEGEKLAETVKEALTQAEHPWLRGQRAFHVGSCDGNATKRILDAVGL